MSFDGDEPSLTVVGTEPNDHGSYLCKLSNKLGSVDTECTLTIQGEPKVAPAHSSFRLIASRGFMRITNCYLVYIYRVHQTVDYGRPME